MDSAASVERRVHPNQHSRPGTEEAPSLLDRIADQPLRAPRGVAGPLAESLSNDHRGARVGGQRGQQSVEATHSGIAEPNALLAMPVDLDDGVVDIEQCVPRVGGGWTGVPNHQPGEPGQRDQEPGGDRVELADVTEGEGPQERSQGRGGVGAGEDPAHPAVSQQRHVIDRVGAGDHASDQRGDLQPGVGALVGGDRQVRIGQVP
jgi:hypothetical protein